MKAEIQKRQQILTDILIFLKNMRTDFKKLSILELKRKGVYQK